MATVPGIEPETSRSVTTGLEISSVRVRAIFCFGQKVEQRCGKRKGRNKRRSKKRRILRRRLKHLKMHSPWTNFVPAAAVFNGQCFWRNYNSAILWQRNYIQGYINGSSLSSVDTASRSTLESDDYKSAVNSSLLSNSTDDCQSDCSVEEEDVEISEEWLAFLEESIKHKEARRLKKEAEDEKESLQEAKIEIDETEKVPGRDDIEDCQSPKECTVDGSRLEEMTELYGKDSVKILGMETAMQLTFNKNCDYYKPPYWPCLPLKINFQD